MVAITIRMLIFSLELDCSVLRPFNRIIVSHNKQTDACSYYLVLNFFNNSFMFLAVDLLRSPGFRCGETLGVHRAPGVQCVHRARCCGVHCARRVLCVLRVLIRLSVRLLPLKWKKSRILDSWLLSDIMLNGSDVFIVLFSTPLKMCVN